MAPSRARAEAAVLSASICAAVVTGQFVAGKAARDALYLANLPVTSLPAMVVATSVCSILVAVASARMLRRWSPATFVPAAFAASALLLVVEWIALAVAPVLVARVVYLQVSGLGPMLGSGFWLIATECFDPHTAKRRFGRIAAAGTLGGLAGGLLAERVAAVTGLSAMLPVLAVLNGIAAWQIRRLAERIDAQTASRRIAETPELSPEAPGSGLRALAKVPYLRDLAGLVTLGTLGAALADYVFRAQAVAVVGNGEGLLRFFAVYYGAISLVTFVIQASLSRLALEKLGLGPTASTPSAALLVGGIGGLLAPGLPGLIAARGGESAFRGSLFRASYELFYTPIPPKQKRAAKSIIDVGFDRLGDAAGAGIVWIILLLIFPAGQTTAILWLAIVVSAGAMALGTRLNRGYVQTLERSLLNRAVDLDLSDITDTTTRTTMLRTLSSLRRPGQPSRPESRDHVIDVRRADAEMFQIEALRSRDRDRILGVLHGESDLTAPLVPLVIPLLAWDAVASEAVDALRRVAEEYVGALTDALVNPNHDFAIRRRLARVFLVCVSQRAVDGLLAGLDDKRFEVRFHCARSLALIQEKNPRVQIERERVFDVVLAEVAVGRRVWDGHRLLKELDDRDERFFADEFLKDRASRSLSHVFTLLSLVLPAEPLQIAYRGLHTEDENLRGTALEYLESVLPRTIRYGLWPYLEERPGPMERAARAREEILADLMRSHESIALSLEAIRLRSQPAETAGRSADETRPARR